MIILDTNMILRFLLQDNKEMADKATEIIDSENVIFTNEVAAEVVYVLNGVYQVSRSEISKVLLDFIEIDNIVSTEYGVLSKALKFFAENKLDFVDCLLCSYSLQYGYEVCTFDVKLNKFLQKINLSLDNKNNSF